LDLPKHSLLAVTVFSAVVAGAVAHFRCEIFDRTHKPN